MTVEFENIQHRIYREIKGELMRGERAPGEALVLRHLAERFKVSQTPVREALLQLVSENVLDGARGTSIRVPEMSLRDLGHVRAIRLELELMATRIAVPNFNRDIVETMEKLHHSMIKAKEKHDRSTLLQRNFQFHYEIYKAAEMPALLSILDGLWARIGPSLRELYIPPFFSMPGTHPHIQVLEALREKNTEKAIEALKSDVSGHGEVLMRRLGEQEPTRP